VARVEATVQGSALLAESRSRSNAYLAARLRALPAEDVAVLERAVELLEQLVEEEE
jgi:hypothetical protein